MTATPTNIPTVSREEMAATLEQTDTKILILLLPTFTKDCMDIGLDILKKRHISFVEILTSIYNKHPSVKGVIDDPNGHTYPATRKSIANLMKHLDESIADAKRYIVKTESKGFA